MAVGGTDSWNCLSSVEIYNLGTNTWTIVSPLNSARRGAGIAVFGGEYSVYVSCRALPAFPSEIKKLYICIRTCRIVCKKKKFWSIGENCVTV